MKLLPNTRVLLVEDIPMNYILARKWLEEEGALVDLAVNGRIATEFVQQSEYDIILMDIMMPEMSGYEATEFIRKKLNIETPIIAVTAISVAGEREKCLALGMQDFVTKPYKKNELIQKIASLSYKKVEAIEPKDLDSSDLIDYSYLREISSGDEEFMFELMATFTEQFEIGFAELTSAFDEFNREQIKQISHRLKSTSSMLGIKILSENLNKMEIACAEMNSDEVKKLLEQISEDQVVVISELKKKMK
ncbi:MAG: response regulator [Flavobacteriales bacterium]|nr:response regulator [Flavobacteriales bacterium]NCP83667.1 response regulator [Bacteroidota bacterium]